MRREPSPRLAAVFVALLVPASVATVGKILPALVLTTAAARFAATGVYQLDGAGTRKDVSAIIGLALCALAVYAALAMTWEDARGARCSRRCGSDAAGSRSTAISPIKLQHLEREAGVREL